MDAYRLRLMDIEPEDIVFSSRKHVRGAPVPAEPAQTVLIFGNDIVFNMTVMI